MVDRLREVEETEVVRGLSDPLPLFCSWSESGGTGTDPGNIGGREGREGRKVGLEGLRVETSAVRDRGLTVYRGVVETRGKEELVSSEKY